MHFDFEPQDIERVVRKAAVYNPAIGRYSSHVYDDLESIEVKLENGTMVLPLEYLQDIRGLLGEEETMLIVSEAFELSKESEEELSEEAKLRVEFKKTEEVESKVQSIFEKHSRRKRLVHVMATIGLVFLGWRMWFITMNHDDLNEISADYVPQVAYAQVLISAIAILGIILLYYLSKTGLYILVGTGLASAIVGFIFSEPDFLFFGTISISIIWAAVVVLLLLPFAKILRH